MTLDTLRKAIVAAEQLEAALKQIPKFNAGLWQWECELEGLRYLLNQELWREEHNRAAEAAKGY